VKRKRRNRDRLLWVDERIILDKVGKLVTNPNTPELLRNEILKAEQELNQFGAVAYPTISRIQFYIHKFAESMK
jgi:hypothetical protein